MPRAALRGKNRDQCAERSRQRCELRQQELEKPFVEPANVRTHFRAQVYDVGSQVPYLGAQLRHCDFERQLTLVLHD
jgi:hypothetical protein